MVLKFPALFPTILSRLKKLKSGNEDYDGSRVLSVLD